MILTPQHISMSASANPSVIVESDAYWLLKWAFKIILVISAIFITEYVVRYYTRELALDRLYDEGVVTTGELTEQHITFRNGGRGGSTTFTYYFKVDGDSKYFESSRMPPNTEILSNKRSTFPVTYLPDDYTVHLFGDVQQGTADDASVQYHGKGIVTVLGVVRLGVLVLAGIGLVICLLVWYWTVTGSRSAVNTNAL